MQGVLAFAVVLVLAMTLKVEGQSDPCEAYALHNYSAWMGDMQRISVGNRAGVGGSGVFGDRALNEILVGGSHDGGTWLVENSDFAFFLPNSYFKTQVVDLLGQLCAGSRWFDIRLTQNQGTWRIFHGNYPIISYGPTLETLMAQQRTFFHHPKYQNEIITWRIKTGSSGSSADLASLIRSNLSPFVVDKVENDMELQSMKLSDIWSQGSKGNLILMAYGWTPPEIPLNSRQGWFWDYKSVQDGEYSDASGIKEMLSRCTYGQIPALLSYKPLAINNTHHRLIGTWWTFTTGDVMDNTDNQWASYPHALHNFFILAGGEIGNVLLSDFFSRYPAIMDIIWTYNYNKFGVYPSNSPISGLSLVDKEVPGLPLLVGQGECVAVESATSEFTTRMIIIFCCVVGGVLLLMILGIVACCCCCKRKKYEDTEYML